MCVWSNQADQCVCALPPPLLPFPHPTRWSQPPPPPPRFRLVCISCAQGMLSPAPPGVGYSSSSSPANQRPLRRTHGSEGHPEATDSKVRERERERARDLLYTVAREGCSGLGVGGYRISHRPAPNKVRDRMSLSTHPRSIIPTGIEAPLQSHTYLSLALLVLHPSSLPAAPDPPTCCRGAGVHQPPRVARVGANPHLWLSLAPRRQLQVGGRQ